MENMYKQQVCLKLYCIVVQWLASTAIKAHELYRTSKVIVNNNNNTNNNKEIQINSIAGQVIRDTN